MKITTLLMVSLCIVNAFCYEFAVNSLEGKCLQNGIERLFKDVKDLCVIYEEGYFPAINQPHVVLNIFTNLTLKLFCVNYVIYLQDFETFVKIFDGIRKSILWNELDSPRGNYLIINNQNDTVRKKLYNHLWQYDIYKVVIMESDKYYSANPFSAFFEDQLSSCQNYTALKFTDYVLLMDKRNFYHSTGYYYLPYTGVPRTKYQGITLMLMDLIETKLNITVIYHISSDEENNEFYTTGMTNQTRDLIYNGSLDSFFISNLYYHYWETYEVTGNAYLEEQMWIIAKPPLKSGIEIMISIFTYNTWLIIIITYVVTSLSFWCMAKFVKERSCDLPASFQIMLGANLSYYVAPRRLKSKYLKALIQINLIYSVVFFNAVHGSLSSVFTNPHYEKGISTFEEMVYSNKIPYWNMQKISLLKKQNSPLVERLIKKSIPYDAVTSPRNRVEFVRSNKNYCTTAYESYLQLYGTDGIRIIGHEFLIPHVIRFGMRKGHPFIPHINKVIKSVAEGGLVRKWVNDIKNATIRNGDTIKSKVILTMSHLEGPFDLLYYGLGTAAIVFVFELITHYINCKRIKIK